MNAQDSSSDEISLAESPKTTSSCFCSGFENISASLRCSFLAILLTINGNLAGSTRLIIATANFKLDTKKKRINNNSRMIKESLVNYRLVRINIPFSLSILEKKKKLIYNYPERGVMPRQQKQANSVHCCLFCLFAFIFGLGSTIIWYLQGDIEYLVIDLTMVGMIGAQWFLVLGDAHSSINDRLSKIPCFSKGENTPHTKLAIASTSSA